MKYQKWQIRLLLLLQLVAFLAIGWHNLRELAFPDGATPTDALIFFILFYILEEIVRVKAHLNVH